MEQTGVTQHWREREDRGSSPPGHTEGGHTQPRPPRAHHLMSGAHTRGGPGLKTSDEELTTGQTCHNQFGCYSSMNVRQSLPESEETLCFFVCVKKFVQRATA